MVRFRQIRGVREDSAERLIRTIDDNRAKALKRRGSSDSSENVTALYEGDLEIRGSESKRARLEFAALFAAPSIPAPTVPKGSKLRKEPRLQD